jgi:hypothetical protein
MKRHYIKPDFKKGYPGDKNIFYECQICKDIINSCPSESVECKCGNVMIDVGFGRMAINDESKVKVFEEKL